MSGQALAALPLVNSAIHPTNLLVSGSAASPGFATPVPGFGEMVTQGLKHVNEQLMASQTDLQQLSVGNVQNLHQIMIRLEEGRLSFQLMMQVRSRLLEAYQDVMKMQV